MPFQRWLVPDDGAQTRIAQPAIEFTDGELSGEDLQELRVWLSGQQEQAIAMLMLSNVDLSDGGRMATLVRMLADRLDAGGAIHLIQPPQLLLHNLYRVGRYPHPLLSVDAPRNEEAYG